MQTITDHATDPVISTKPLLLNGNAGRAKRINLNLGTYPGHNAFGFAVAAVLARTDIGRVTVSGGVATGSNTGGNRRQRCPQGQGQQRYAQRRLRLRHTDRRQGRRHLLVRQAARRVRLHHIDTITDFGNGNDSIHLRQVIFGELMAGVHSPENFLAAPGAFAGLNGQRYIIYNTSNGALY